MSSSAEDVVAMFVRLRDKATHLFAGLRDLPQHSKAQWQPYFQKTFSVFTKVRVCKSV